MGAVRILSVGTATQDVFLLGGKVFTPVCTSDGEYYEHLPLGAKLDLDDMVFATGGNAGNAAVTFARQGLESAFMGAIGTDPAGQAVMADFDAESVDTRFVHQSADCRTAYSTLLVAPDGERTILRFAGQAPRAADRGLTMRAVEAADWLYISSVGSMELLEKLITLAAKHRVRVAFNPSPAELQHPAKVRALLDDVAVLIANKEELSALAEGKSLEELARHAVHLAPVVVATDGKRGSVVTDGIWLITAGMYEAAPVVDRTGAGDAFGSGFVARLAQGKSLAEATIFASANATSVVGTIGAKAGILPKTVRLHAMPLKITKLKT